MSDQFGLSATEQEKLREILNTAAERIERVAVFGSRATGRYRPNSDLDLVLYGNVDEASCDRLWTALQESSLPFSVDIVSYAAITNPALRAHIDAVARPIFIHTELGLTTLDENDQSATILATTSNNNRERTNT